MTLKEHFTTRTYSDLIALVTLVKFKQQDFDSSSDSDVKTKIM